MYEFTGNQERLAAPVPHVKAGLSILFSRRYRARTALTHLSLVSVLMDIAAYGVQLYPDDSRSDRNFPEKAPWINRA